MRFKVNKEAYGQLSFQKSTKDSHSESERPLTRSGKPDMRFKVNKEAYGQSYFQKSTEDSHSESKRTLALCSAVAAFSWGRDARKPASPAQTRLNRLLGKPFCKNNVMLPSPKQVHRVIMCQPYCKM